jgi:hypothetical protein
LLCVTGAAISALVGCAGKGDGGVSPDMGVSSVSNEQLATCIPVDASDEGSACPLPQPSFAKDIQPLLDHDCNTCHTQGSTLWPLVGYQDVRDWSYSILLDIDACKMPPLDGGTSLSATDRNLLLGWIACGAQNN